jgi:nucleotidyltransferase AbiEii toxin of type IV toxin-antitoxin system
MTKAVTNFAASVRARLLAVTKQRKGEFQFTLQRYAAERFLYRLGVSRHRDRFVLKGAMLFMLWDETRFRPTKDLDLAGYWANDATSLEAAFLEICSIPYPHDGLEFALDTLDIMPIRDAAEYHGFRVTLDVRLAAAVIPFQVDIGFGDVIVPGPVEVVYPVLLDADPPRIRAYPREASIAEKLHAMVSLADANSRLKDFFDIYALSSRFDFAGEALAAAISATFSNRSTTKFEPWPVALTPAFYADAPRSNQWRRFLTRLKLTDAPVDFGPVGERIITFLSAPSRAVVDGNVFPSVWPPGGPWR